MCTFLFENVRRKGDSDKPSSGTCLACISGFLIDKKKVTVALPTHYSLAICIQIRTRVYFIVPTLVTEPIRTTVQLTESQRKTTGNRIKSTFVHI